MSHFVTCYMEEEELLLVDKNAFPDDAHWSLAFSFVMRAYEYKSVCASVFVSQIEVGIICIKNFDFLFVPPFFYFCSSRMRSVQLYDCYYSPLCISFFVCLNGKLKFSFRSPTNNIIVISSMYLLPPFCVHKGTKNKRMIMEIICSAAIIIALLWIYRLLWVSVNAYKTSGKDERASIYKNQQHQ